MKKWLFLDSDNLLGEVWNQTFVKNLIIFGIMCLKKLSLCFGMQFFLVCVDTTSMIRAIPRISVPYSVGFFCLPLNLNQKPFLQKFFVRFWRNIDMQRICCGSKSNMMTTLGNNNKNNHMRIKSICGKKKRPGIFRIKRACDKTCGT